MTKMTKEATIAVSGLAAVHLVPDSDPRCFGKVVVTASVMMIVSTKYYVSRLSRG